jgi:probable rRNA maturation factor
MSVPGESSFLFERCPRGIDRRRLRLFHARLQQEVADAAFNCLLTRDARLKQLNRDFLGHDYPTDVLSFPDAGGNGMLGDIAISVDRAAEQAAAFGHTLEEELEILLLHGTLHLMGMDHENDRGRMARAETNWRKKLGLPHGLIGRSRQ